MTSGEFGNPLRKFKLVFLGEQSGKVKIMAEAMVTPRRKCRRPAMVTPKSYPYP